MMNVSQCLLKYRNADRKSSSSLVLMKHVRVEQITSVYCVSLFTRCLEAISFFKGTLSNIRNVRDEHITSQRLCKMAAPNRRHHHATPYSLCTQHLSPNPQPRTPRIPRGGFCDVNERSVSDRRIRPALPQPTEQPDPSPLYCLMGSIGAGKSTDVIYLQDCPVDERKVNSYHFFATHSCRDANVLVSNASVTQGKVLETRFKNEDRRSGITNR